MKHMFSNCRHLLLTLINTIHLYTNIYLYMHTRLQIYIYGVLDIYKRTVLKNKNQKRHSIFGDKKYMGIEI
uniref:Uncharacterized protein n=1 Tax=Octopus bimaculoides TaxID=37653 RepID=A0A0L8H5V9_OCTBM